MQKSSKNVSRKRAINIFGSIAIVMCIILLATVVISSALKTQEDDIPVESTVQSSSVSRVQVQEEPVIEQKAPEHTIPKRDDVDFKELKAINADTIGFINVPGTLIDYPVVNGVDNLKYLTTNFNGEYDILGTVFADMANNSALSDPVTVLYGHYEPNGTFFTQLHNYRDAQYFEENPDIFLYTPSVEYKYEVVAAFINDNYSLMYEKNYQDETQLQGFINHIASTPDTTANLKLDDVNTDDKFIVLSTCMNANDSYENRYIVVGRLVYAQKVD